MSYRENPCIANSQREVEALQIFDRGVNVVPERTVSSKLIFNSTELYQFCVMMHVQSLENETKINSSRGRIPILSNQNIEFESALFVVTDSETEVASFISFYLLYRITVNVILC